MDTPGDLKEPSYDGKPLSGWIFELRGNDKRERIKVAESRTSPRTSKEPRDRDTQARIKAAEALGNFDLRDDEASRGKVLKALRMALGDQDSTVRFVAGDSLRCYGKHAVPVFLNALNDSDAEVRTNAVRALGEIPQWEFGNNRLSRPRLPGRDHKDSAVRTEAIDAALCAVLLKDKDAGVRAVAAGSLTKMGKDAVPALAEALRKDKDAGVRRAAAWVLASIGRDGVPALVSAIETGDAQTRKFAISALSQLSPENSWKAIPALGDLLKGEDEDLRFEAVQAIERMRDGVGEALPALLAASKTPDRPGKAASELIKRIHKAPRSTAPGLLPFLKDPEPYVRLKAVEVLCEMEEADKECLASLLDLVKRRNSQFRKEAARLLLPYGSAAKEAVPALIEVVRTDSDPGAVQEAVRALGAIGPDAMASVPALKALEKEYNRQLADVQASLKQIPARDARVVHPAVLTCQSQLATVQASLRKIEQ
jgi:HEAT repeat protein